jgi:hypothetical protein
VPIKPDHLTDISDVLGAQVTSGEVFVTVGDAVDGQGWGANAAMWGPDGYIAVPNQATQGAACRAIYLVDGNMKRVFACRDNRIASKAGTLAPGDRAIVTDAAARVRVLKAANMVELYSETGSGDPLKVVVDGANDIVNLVGSGSDVLLTGDNAEMSAGASSVLVDASTGVQASVGSSNVTIAANGDIGASNGATSLTISAATGDVVVTLGGVPVFQITSSPVPLGALLPVMVSVAGVPTPSTKVYAFQ